MAGHSVMKPRIVWPGLAFLVASWFLLQTLGLDWRVEMLLTDFVGYLLPIMLAVGVSGLVSWRIVGSGIEHRFWGLLVIIGTLILVAETYWTWYVIAVDFHGPPSDSPLRLLHVAAALVAAVMFAQLTPFGSGSVPTRVRQMLDVVAVAVVIWPALYLLWTQPVFEAVGATQADAIWSAFYPLLGIGILLCIASVLVGWRRYRWHAWERLLAVSFFMYAAGMVVMPLWFPLALAAREPSLSLLTPVLGVGFYLLFAAGVYRLSAGDGESLTNQWPSPRFISSDVQRAIPVALAAALPVLGVVAYAQSDVARSIPVVVVCIVLALLLVARSWVVAFERVSASKSAQTDPITGVHNHRSLDRQLESALEDAARSERNLSLLVVGVGSARREGLFGGQAAGDEVLTWVAHVLVAEGGREAEVFRLGSDEFAVLLPTSTQGAAAYGRTVWRRVDRESWDALGISIGMSVGIAGAPMHGVDSESLLTAAETARAVAEGAETAPVVVYTDAMKRIEPEEALERARMRAMRATVRSLAQAVDARDETTRGHSEAVAELASALAQVVGMTDRQVQVVELAALVHDVGKIGISDAVLQKRSPLSTADREQIEAHPALGERILAPAGFADLLPIVRWHHERWDGTGYPDGISGYDIPVEARILAICDVFEMAAASRRSEGVRGVRAALEIIRANAGSQFDPVLAGTFARMIGMLGEQQRVAGMDGESTDGVFAGV
jgi:diguanylate cyclase (GGDEF)-like protein